MKWLLYHIWVLFPGSSGFEKAWDSSAVRSKTCVHTVAKICGLI
jgi:hypothetical protein